MKTVTNIICIVCLFFATSTSGQVLETTVSFSFGGWYLEDAIAEIGKIYDIQFVYSPDKIPVKETVTVSVEEVPLSEGLDELLSDLPVKYLAVGSRVVFKPAPLKKLRSYTQMELPQSNEVWVMRTPLDNVQVKKEIPAESTAPTLDTTEITPSVKLLVNEKYKNIRQSGGNSFFVPTIDLSFLKDLNNDKSEFKTAQVSVAPGVSSNSVSGDAASITNRVSFNLTWGVNGGVNGGEIGLIGNTVNGDVQGGQVAGLINRTKGNVVGTQVAGLVNHTDGRVSGVQISGLRNRAQSGNGVQISFLSNKIKENYVGVQIAGLTNRTKGKNFGWQIAGLSNVAKDGQTQVQISGLRNRANDIQIAQIGAINSAKKVKGVQIGLINFADTVSIVSIGLLNFIKKGYNRLELSRGDIYQLNAAYKFGSNRFYNIVKTSLHSEENNLIGIPKNWNEDNISWSLGYGIGTTLFLRERTRWNFEVSLSHVNENAGWSTDQNWWAQTRLTLDMKLFKKLTVFVGGSINGSVSDRIDSETGEIGSDLPNKNVFATGDIEYDNGRISDIKIWSGWSIGIRF